ncbi:MAG: hypothetical protein MUC62_04980 [Candidatus Thermoplasmatota archaeon]|jgi:hypothetical protein|nr:hypothetical protein [Candidatus Thermoplasmatota archaeon]
MPDKEPSFIKGMLVSLAIYTASLPIAVIPPIGPMLSITIVPYLSSALGTRLTRSRERLPLALTTALIWSTVETVLVLAIMMKVGNISPMGFKLDSLGTILLMVLWLSNLVFGSLGAVHPWKDPFTGPEEGPDSP